MQCAHSATIWAFGRTGDPCFEILGASLLPRCVGFDAISTLEIWHVWIFTNFTHFHLFSHFFAHLHHIHSFLGGRVRCAQGIFLGYFRSLPLWDPSEGGGYEG